MLQSLCWTEQIHLFHDLTLIQEAEKPYGTFLQLRQNLSLCSLQAITLQ